MANRPFWPFAPEICIVHGTSFTVQPTAYGWWITCRPSLLNSPNLTACCPCNEWFSRAVCGSYLSRKRLFARTAGADFLPWKFHLPILRLGEIHQRLQDAVRTNSRGSCRLDSERLVRIPQEGRNCRNSYYLHATKQSRDFRSHVVGFRWRRGQLGDASPSIPRKIRPLAVEVVSLE